MSESENEEEKMEESEAVYLWCGSAPCICTTYGKDIIEGGHQIYSEEENIENIPKNMVIMENSNLRY
jgi:hypothetical protein